MLAPALAWTHLESFSLERIAARRTGRIVRDQLMWGTVGGSYPSKLELALQEKTGGGAERYTGYHPSARESPAVAVG